MDLHESKTKTIIQFAFIGFKSIFYWYVIFPCSSRYNDR